MRILPRKHLLDLLSVRRRAGFLLPLAALLLAAAAVATANVARVAVQEARIRAAQGVAAEIQAIQSAARRYMDDHATWPASLDDLKSGGYLEASWSGSNPWGSPYTVETNGDWLVVRTEAPDATLRAHVLNGLPAAGESGNEVVAATLPSANSDIDSTLFVSRAGTEADRTMQDELLMDGNTVTEVGDAREADDLLSLGMAEDRYVNNTGDTMTGDLRIAPDPANPQPHTPTVGARDGFSGPGNTGDLLLPRGTSILGNLHTVQDVYLRSLGLWVSQWEPRPKNWTCTEGSENNSYSCCPPGYILMSHSISNSSGGYLWWDGSRFCAGGGGAPAGTRTVCCK